MKTRFENEEERLTRAIRDTDARFTAFSTRLTQQVSSWSYLERGELMNFFLSRDWSCIFIPFAYTHALPASLLLDWATKVGKLLAHVICLPHKGGGIPLGTFPQRYNKWTFQLFLHTMPFALIAKREAVITMITVIIVGMILYLMFYARICVVHFLKYSCLKKIVSAGLRGLL